MSRKFRNNLLRQKISVNLSNEGLLFTMKEFMLGRHKIERKLKKEEDG